MHPLPKVLEADYPRDPMAAVENFARGDELAWLDSSAVRPDAPAGGRHSLICTRPTAVVEQFDGAVATLSIGGEVVRSDDDGWRLWREAAARFGMPADSELAGAAAIVPGWIGYIGFEMARQLERLPASHREDLGLPLMRMALFDRGILLDHVERRARLIAWPSDDTAAEEMRSRWNDAGRRESPVAAPPRFAAPSMRAEVSQADYERSVRRALEYIAAGDIYQVNLSQRWTLDGLGDPLAVHAAIRASNPAPHAALLRFGDRAVVSASPELFLSMHNGRVLTRPIKGTRPRTGDAVLDEAYRRQLLASDKDAAELAMIVDLHRNDLGRVCEFGSIRVCRARLLEEHPTVFHTVAEIEGRLARGRDAFDLLGACFPAGSITGAPKIRAIEIIDELEPCARGAYTGAIGVVGLDGSMAMNVAIRTLQLRGGRGVLHAGGGIVADSDPTEEYEETLAKARGIMRALGPSACAAAEPSGSAGNEGGVSLCPESGGLRGGRTRPLA